MKRVALAAVTLAALTACGGSQTDVAPMGMSDSAVMSAESMPMGAVEPGAQIITNGYLALESDDPGQTSLQAQAIIAAADGRVERSAENRYDNSITVTLGVRVPAAEFPAVMEDLSELGTVTSKDISRTDVTTQVLDLDARIAALEISVKRMNELLEQAETVGDLIAAEGALAERQGQLDSLVSQRDYLSDQVEMSAISITITGGTSSDDLASLLLLVGGVVIGVIIGVVIGALWWAQRRKA